MADRPSEFTLRVDDAERSFRCNQNVAPSALVGRLRHLPVSVAVAVTAVVLVVTARIAHAEPDFPHHPPVACLALLGVVLTVVLAERSLGSVRTLLIGVLAPTLGVLGTLLTVTIGSAFGEALDRKSVV